MITCVDLTKMYGDIRAVDGKNRYFARTGFTGRWVEVSSADAQSAIADISTILE
jgi:hypothetical protein